MALSRKRQVFLDNYLRTWNGSEAAIAAGYSAKSARVIASNLLALPEVKAEITARLAELKMGTDEVLVRLTEQGRASIGDFFDVRGPKWDMIQKNGRLVKVIAKTKEGWRLELYDGQAAIIQMGKALGIFAEKHEISGTLALKLYENVSPDDWDKNESIHSQPDPAGALA